MHGAPDMDGRRFAQLLQSSRNRVVNRCAASGRRRAYMRKFGCSRLTFREAALAGLIPGITKSSW